MSYACRLRVLSNSQFYFQHKFASTSSAYAFKDHYTTLGVSRAATTKEIKAAFYELSNKYHPDRNPKDKENASAKFQSILNAYEILSNEAKRKEYDNRFFPSDDLEPTSVRAKSGWKEWQFTDMDSNSKDIEVTRSRNLYRAGALTNRLGRWNVTARDSVKGSLFKDPEVRVNLDVVKELAYYVIMGLLGIGILKSLYTEMDFTDSEETAKQKAV